MGLPGCVPTLKKFICLILCLASAGLTTYRVQLWFTHYTRLASKMMISAYDEHQQGLPFPLVTICNVNPARGLNLYNPHAADSLGRSALYELFSDAFQGRLSTIGPRNKFEASIYHVMDKTTHRLVDMLRRCSVGQTSCSAKNFTKSVWPMGVCYTYNGQTSGFDEMQLTLDPQGYDYLIPNPGFVGFRVMLHDRGDPLWSVFPSAIYAGPTFHTMLRVVGLKKLYKHRCTTNREWAHCVHTCMQDILRSRCHCATTDCTLDHLMHCGIRMQSLIEILHPNQCKCEHPCKQLTYSIESVTQALKSPLFPAQSMLWAEKDLVDEVGNPETQVTVQNLDVLRPVDSTSNQKKQIRDALLLQTWAFLRETNRTAFEELRRLASILQNLHTDLRTVERSVSSTPLEVSQPIAPDWKDSVMMRANGLCTDSEDHRKMVDRVRHLGQEFVRLFQQSVLFRDVKLILGEDLHVHLVRLFFLKISNELDHLATQLQHNDLFSDVTMLDLQHKANHCKESNSVRSSGIANRSNWIHFSGPRSYPGERADVASLQTVLLSVDSRFKQIRSTFSQLLAENPSLVDAVSIDKILAKADQREHESLVTLTVQLTRDKNRLVRLESAQLIYNPFTELFDLIISGLVVAFLAVFLFDFCFTRDDSSTANCCCYSDPASLKASFGEDYSPSKANPMCHKPECIAGKKYTQQPMVFTNPSSVVHLREGTTLPHFGNPFVCTSSNCPCCIGDERPRIERASPELNARCHLVSTLSNRSNLLGGPFGTVSSQTANSPIHPADQLLLPTESNSSADLSNDLLHTFGQNCLTQHSPGTINHPGSLDIATPCGELSSQFLWATDALDTATDKSACYKTLNVDCPMLHSQSCRPAYSLSTFSQSLTVPHARSVQERNKQMIKSVHEV